MEALDTKRIFSVDEKHFEETVLTVFKFQFENQHIYRTFCKALNRNPENVHSISDIPFLPIRFFKSHSIIAGETNAELIFESSGTTGANTSKHYVADADIYVESFSKSFRKFYGNPRDYCILALLPSYLERKNSSLVFMVEHLMQASGHEKNNFFLHDFESLNVHLSALEFQQQPTILIGVTYALLDFATQFPTHLNHTIVMETGGMKGRREEMLREEVHQVLQESLGIASVHSEYGMTELLSQAYSPGKGVFSTPPWMKVLARDVYNPLNISIENKTGALNIIDLANVYSCAFIATEDLGMVHKNGTFEVMGRMDNSDMRGCSLMYAG